jgi:5'(3')-deoxyribonucleotidase
MTKQVIGLDMDGVIVDNTENKIKFAKKLGFDLKPEDTPADFIEKILPEDILGKLRNFLYHNSETALEASLVDGAKEGLNFLQKSKIPYFLISRRKNPEIAKALLKKRGLWPKFLNEENAFFVLHAEDKDQKAAELGVNVYLDDQPSVLEKLESVEKRFLFDRFERFSDLSFPHIKISSWKDFLSHIHNG